MSGYDLVKRLKLMRDDEITGTSEELRLYIDGSAPLVLVATRKDEKGRVAVPFAFSASEARQLRDFLVFAIPD